MSKYPSAQDDNGSLISISDNLSELGGVALNQARSAIFAIEGTLGINPQGSKNSVSDRLNISINADGTLNSTALAVAGLISLPITDSMVSPSAAISESKLNLAHTTTYLQSEINALNLSVSTLNTEEATNTNNLLLHISGATYLQDGHTIARHKLSAIDVDTDFTDKNANDRVPNGNAFLQINAINADLVNHENSISLAHNALAISVDTSTFLELPQTANNAQLAFQAVDGIATKSLTTDRTILHSNGIIRGARVQNLTLPDGYNYNLIPITPVKTYLGDPSQTAPTDSISTGDDVIAFYPASDAGYIFDSLFTNVLPGDILYVNYGPSANVSNVFTIASISFIPGSSYVVRINGINDAEVKDLTASAAIYRSTFDTGTRGVLAVAGVHRNINPTTACTTYLDSVIIGSPRGAAAVGLQFDANQIDGYHYNLYLRLYPAGDSNLSAYVDLPPIDVTGNLGSTPGHYTLDSIVEESNIGFRSAGYNYRFIAFQYKGNFGVMLADAINDSCFAIMGGSSYAVANVIDTLSADGYQDGLGFGPTKAGYVSTENSYSSAIDAASHPTIIIHPATNRYAIINGSRRDTLAVPSTMAADGYNYWYASIISVDTDTSTMPNSVTCTYQIDAVLLDQGLTQGKTIVIQPVSTPTSIITGYGRFIIESVAFTSTTTVIKVINAVHGSGNPLGSSLPIGTQVELYFSSDSCTFNQSNLVGSGSFVRYHEIYVDNLGHTQSIERARMPIQSGSASPPLLDTSTSAWRIRNVSKNMQGYNSNFQNFIRLQVVFYDSTKEEFYLILARALGTGQDSTTSGPIAKGRKNTVIRVYDSLSNYIDVEYREDTNSPGGSILLPDGLVKYIDIELFNTYVNDDEFFLLAGISHYGQNFVSSTDLREFGTTSEKNLSDSGIKFIESRDKYLHANGIIRGFEYDGEIVATLNSITLGFYGGSCIVNGHIVTVSPCSVKLPLVNQGTAPAIVEYFVCVNEFGDLVAIPKFNGTVFFDHATNMFIESLSFKDIVNSRKDLVIIARVSTTNYGTLYGPIIYALNEVSDARRFITNESINQFSWGNDLVGGFTQGTNYQNASFINRDQIQNWVNEYGVNEIVVKTVNITSTIKFNILNPVVFKSGIFNVTAESGLEISCGNISFEGCTFNYNPVWTPANIYDNMNVYSMSGCITSHLNSDASGAGTNQVYTYDGYTSNSNINYVSAQIMYTNIKDCIFNASNAQRPPFISFYLSNNGVYKTINIEKNRFNGGALDSIAICFYYYNTAHYGGYISGINISKNVGTSSVLLSTALAVQSLVGVYILAYPLCVLNTTIENNFFGGIYYFTVGDTLKILNNDCAWIQYYVTGIAYTSGGNTYYGATDTNWNAIPINAVNGYTKQFNTYVSGNYAQQIVASGGIAGTTEPQLACCEISNNNLINQGASPLLQISAHGQAGIFVDYADITCSNNNINNYSGTLDTLYETGIYTFGCFGTISGNYIKNFLTYGIYANTSSVAITGNKLFRGTQPIQNYIYDNSGTSEIVGNHFDSMVNGQTVGGTAVFTGMNFTQDVALAAANLNSAISQSVSSNYGLVDRNYNHIQQANLPGIAGAAPVYLVDVALSPKAFLFLPLSDSNVSSVTLLDYGTDSKIGSLITIPSGSNSINIGFYFPGDFQIPASGTLICASLDTIIGVGNNTTMNSFEMDGYVTSNPNSLIDSSYKMQLLNSSSVSYIAPGLPIIGTGLSDTPSFRWSDPTILTSSGRRGQRQRTGIFLQIHINTTAGSGDVLVIHMNPNFYWIF